MKDSSKQVKVQTVQHTVNQTWFREALKMGNAAIILAHMDFKDPLIDVILSRVRQLQGNEYPVVFLTGHTHIRGSSILDRYAISIEFGHYLDTIGFVGINFTSPPTFNFSNIVPSRENLVNITNISSDRFDTEEGIEIKRIISITRKAMSLDEVIGCNPRTLSPNDPFTWNLYLNTVVPVMLHVKDRDNYFSMVSPGAFRYNLFQGVVTRDDVISFSPFHEKFYVASGVMGSILLGIIRNDTFLASSSHSMNISNIKPEKQYNFYFPGFYKDRIEAGLLQFSSTVELSAVETPLNTTSVWEKYIQESWPRSCEEGLSNHGTTHENTLSFGAIVSNHEKLFVIIAVCVGVHIPYFLIYE